MAEALLEQRGVYLRKATALTVTTLSWNVIEGVVAVAAAIASGSTALLAFGIDSFVESTSAGVMLWRLVAEKGLRESSDIERLDRRAEKLIGLSLLGLAAFVGVESISALLDQEKPSPSVVGLAITVLSLVLMMWLARAKRETASALKSRAMAADAVQTTACWWLSLTALAGVGLNTAFGWWWADPLAALAMALFLVKEGREAWRGHQCCG